MRDAIPPLPQYVFIVWFLIKQEKRCMFMKFPEWLIIASMLVYLELIAKIHHPRTPLEQL